MPEEDISPAILLIVCEGRETEPQYFEIVKTRRRLNSGVARVKIFGDKGQHKKLVDEAIVTRQTISNEESVDPDQIEVWVVCDKDDMKITLQELQEYSARHNIKLAFSDPKFEVFLLQHFKRSASNLTGKPLDDLLHQQMTLSIGSGYKKNNLKPLDNALDREPALLEKAISNCKHICNPNNSPYTTVHELLERLISLAP